MLQKGEVDATFFAPDCFHFSSKGHGMGAINLWNNMVCILYIVYFSKKKMFFNFQLEPVGNKTSEWGVYDLKVPTDVSYMFI